MPLHCYATIIGSNMASAISPYIALWQLKRIIQLSITRLLYLSTYIFLFSETRDKWKILFQDSIDNW